MSSIPRWWAIETFQIILLIYYVTIYHDRATVADVGGCLEKGFGVGYLQLMFQRSARSSLVISLALWW